MMQRVLNHAAALADCGGSQFPFPFMSPSHLKLFSLVLAVQLAGIWILPLLDRDETYYAEVTREMNARGDYVVPHFNNQPWLEKPPLLYWTQSVAFRAFGESGFAARFPAVVATALTSLVIFCFGTRLCGAAAAWRAAIVYALCLQLMIYGKAGTPDAFVILFHSLAVWAGWEVCHGTEARRWWWVFYLSLAAMILAKGPLAVLPVAALAVYAFWTRPEEFFRRMKFVHGFVLTAALTGAWVIPMMAATKGEFFHVFVGEHVWKRSISPMDGHGSSSIPAYVALLPCYVLLLVPGFLPWTPWLWGGLKHIFTSCASVDKFLVCNIAIPFGLFSVAVTKLPHYTLPAYPFIAIGIARSIPDIWFKRLAISMVVANLLVAFIGFPIIAGANVPAILAASPLLNGDMAIGSVEYLEPGLLWEVRRKVDGARSNHEGRWVLGLEPKDVDEFMRHPGPRVCIVPTDLLAQFAIHPTWKVESAEGMDLAKGKPLALSMIVKLRHADGVSVGQSQSSDSSESSSGLDNLHEAQGRQ